MELKQVGLIHSPYKERKDAPRQGKLSDQESVIEIFEDFLPAMTGLDELSHIIALYWGDRSDRTIVQSSTHWRPQMTGVFSTRSPNRPNPIAFCVCKILEIKENTIRVTGLDALDGSPLLDLKAYSAEIDSYPEATREGGGCHSCASK